MLGIEECVLGAGRKTQKGNTLIWASTTHPWELLGAPSIFAGAPSNFPISENTLMIFSVTNSSYIF